MIVGSNTWLNIQKNVQNTMKNFLEIKQIQGNVFVLNDIDKSNMIGMLWDKYIKNPTDKNYQIWKNWCNEFYPKKIRGLKNA